jgi:uncharacterized membrane protein
MKLEENIKHTSLCVGKPRNFNRGHRRGLLERKVQELGRDFDPHSGGRNRESGATDGAPRRAVRSVQSLMSGIDDFAAMPSHAVFLCVIYPLDCDIVGPWTKSPLSRSNAVSRAWVQRATER